MGTVSSKAFVSIFSEQTCPLSLRPTNVNVLDNPENFSNTSNSFVARFAAQRAAAQTNEASRPVAGANNQQEPQQPQPPQRGSIRWKIAPTRTRKRGGRR